MSDFEDEEGVDEPILDAEDDEEDQVEEEVGIILKNECLHQISVFVLIQSMFFKLECQIVHTSW